LNGSPANYESFSRDFGYHPLKAGEETTPPILLMLMVAREWLVVSKILNHVETGVTAVYDPNGYDLEKRAALDFWGKPLDQIVSGKGSKVLAFVARARCLFAICL
jgi:hypothetical protein